MSKGKRYRPRSRMKGALQLHWSGCMMHDAECSSHLAHLRMLFISLVAPALAVATIIMTSLMSTTRSMAFALPLTRSGTPRPTTRHASSPQSLLSMASSNIIISHNWERITNHQTSKTVKLFKSIHRSKSKRASLGLTIAEGVRLVSDILENEDSRQLVRRIVISESLLTDDSGEEDPCHKLKHWLNVVDQESRQRKAECINISDNDTTSINIGTNKVVDACSGTVTSQGVVALMETPPPYNPLYSASSDDSDIVSPPFYLILDGLSDPGNVGTILRSCAASHVAALILLPGSCDVWNPKAVRSASGASFRIPILEMSNEKEALDHVLNLLEQLGVDNDRVFAATMESSRESESRAHYEIDFTKSAALILGREGEGLRNHVKQAMEDGRISTVHVPMAPGIESLNAAVCGSIIMFERMRQLMTVKTEDKALAN